MDLETTADMANIVAVLDERNLGFTDALLLCVCSERIGRHILGHRKWQSEAKSAPESRCNASARDDTSVLDLVRSTQTSHHIICLLDVCAPMSTK